MGAFAGAGGALGELAEKRNILTLQQQHETEMQKSHLSTQANLEKAHILSGIGSVMLQNAGMEAALPWLHEAEKAANTSGTDYSMDKFIKSMTETGIAKQAQPPQPGITRPAAGPNGSAPPAQTGGGAQPSLPQPGTSPSATGPAPAPTASAAPAPAAATTSLPAPPSAAPLPAMGQPGGGMTAGGGGAALGPVAGAAPSPAAAPNLPFHAQSPTLDQLQSTLNAAYQERESQPPMSRGWIVANQKIAALTKSIQEAIPGQIAAERELSTAQAKAGLEVQTKSKILSDELAQSMAAFKQFAGASAGGTEATLKAGPLTMKTGQVANFMQATVASSLKEKLGRKPTATELVQGINAADPEMHAARLNALNTAAQLREFRASMAGLQLQLLQSQTGPEAVKGWVAGLEANPDLDLSKVPANIRPLVMANFTAAHPGYTVPTKLPVQAQTQLDTAQVAVGHAQNLMGMLQDPYIRSNLGPIQGRLAKGESTIGDIPGATPQEKQKLQDFLTSIKYFQGREVRTIVGGRFIQGIFDQFSRVSADPHMAPDLFVGSISSAMRAAETTMEQTERGRWGGKTAPQGLSVLDRMGLPRPTAGLGGAFGATLPTSPGNTGGGVKTAEDFLKKIGR